MAMKNEIVSSVNFLLKKVLLMGKRGLFMFICPVALFKFHSAWYFETANTASLKRKHSVLTVEMKMEIVRALENRASLKSFSQKFEVARSWGRVSL